MWRRRVEGGNLASPVTGEGQPAESAPISDRLKLALRRARIDDAERTNVVAELRSAEMARLEILRDAILPIAAEIPPGVDLFDIELVATEHPRLFIDMIGFVEMGRDRRTYNFVQNTRHGRVVIAESERIEPIVDAVTDYIARRLIEREKALASDGTLERAARAYAEAQGRIAARQSRGTSVNPARAGSFGRLLAFLFEFLGSALICALLAAGAFTAWKYASTLWFARHGWG